MLLIRVEINSIMQMWSKLTAHIGFCVKLVCFVASFIRMVDWGLKEFSFCADYVHGWEGDGVQGWIV